MKGKHGATARAKPKKAASKSKAPFKSYPIVLIQWQDASFANDSGWLDKDEFKPCLVAASAVGYKVYEGKNAWGEEVVVLSAALTYQAEDFPHFTSSFTIPKRMILKSKEIKP